MEKINKREFLKRSGLCMGGLFCTNLISNAMSANNPGLWKWSREAIFYSATPRGVKCGICPNECTLKPGETSVCNSRVES